MEEMILNIVFFVAVVWVSAVVASILSLMVLYCIDTFTDVPTNWFMFLIELLEFLLPMRKP